MEMRKTSNNTAVYNIAKKGNRPHFEGQNKKNVGPNLFLFGVVCSVLVSC
jgi:hypothetical protein